MDLTDGLNLSTVFLKVHIYFQNISSGDLLEREKSRQCGSENSYTEAYRNVDP